MERSRRVLVVIPSNQRRGAEIQGFALVDGLRRRGWDAAIVAVEPARAGTALNVPVLATSRRSLRGLMQLRRLARGTTVIAHGSSSLVAVSLALLGTRTPWVYRNIGDPAAWVASRWARERTGVLMRRASGFAVLWPGAADALRRLYRLGGQPMDVVPNDRDPGAFTAVTDAERESARAGLGVSGPVVLLLGALTEEKQPLVAVGLMQDLVGATLLIAGGGPLAAEVERRAEQVAPGRVRMLGVIPDPASVIAASDAVVLPSRTEGMPGTIIEALMRGVPVAATAVGAVTSMLADERDGTVVPVGDARALASALRVLLDEPNSLAQRLERSARAVQAYTPERALDAWERLLQRVSASR